MCNNNGQRVPNQTFCFLSGAAIAQWIRLRLPSFCPGFESQTHHLSFNKCIFELYHWERTKINLKKTTGLAIFNILFPDGFGTVGILVTSTFSCVQFCLAGVTSRILPISVFSESMDLPIRRRII